MQITVTENALLELRNVRGDKPALFTKIIMSGYGWGGPNFSLTLEEPRETDHSEVHDGITVSVDSELLNAMGAFSVDFRKTSFSKGFVVRPSRGGSTC